MLNAYGAVIRYLTSADRRLLAALLFLLCMHFSVADLLTLFTVQGGYQVQILEENKREVKHWLTPRDTFAGTDVTT